MRHKSHLTPAQREEAAVAIRDAKESRMLDKRAQLRATKLAVKVAPYTVGEEFIVQDRVNFYSYHQGKRVRCVQIHGYVGESWSGEKFSVSWHATFEMILANGKAHGGRRRIEVEGEMML